MGDAQTQLFGLPDEPTGPLGPAPSQAEHARLSAALPPNLRLGTSSWTFAGWDGIVYDRPASKAVLTKHGLAAYAQHPLFRTAGVDRTYYATIPAETFAAYAAQVPAGFRFLVKAHQDCTLPWLPHDRSGGGPNPRFLDPAYATERVVAPFVEGLGEHAGPLLFQFSPLDLSLLGGARGFLRRLVDFLARLPRGPVYAVELRSPGALTRDYGRALADLGAVHCLNAHPTMPSPIEQVRSLGEAFGAMREVVIRWMLFRNYGYADAVERYAPFNALVDEDPETRESLAELTAWEQRPVTVVINNKAEGSSPLSVVALARAVAARPTGRPGRTPG